MICIYHEYLLKWTLIFLFLTLQQQTKATVTSDNADTGSEIVIAGYQVVVSMIL